MIRSLTHLTCLALSLSVASQALATDQMEDGVLQLHSLRKTELRKHLRMPEVNGLKVLKCDFHMHTVFTDGHVWPNVRVQEAWREGLDAFAFTEHLEYTPHKDHVKVDPSAPHELAKERAAEHGLTMIKGVELTRRTPPGHFNALFVTDQRAFPTDLAPELDQVSIDKAVEQKAFIFWNHPGWQVKRQPDSYEWLPFLEKQYQDKKLHGVEVANGFSVYPKAIDWALDRNLTLMANTDVHNVVAHEYDLDQPFGHRTMTLIFAKDASPAAIREALEAGKTVAWAGKYLIGKEENVRDLVKAAIQLKPSHYQKANRNKELVKSYEISNPTDLYLELNLVEGSGTERLVLHPHTSLLLSAKEGQSNLKYEVSNTFIRSDKRLMLELALQ